MLEKICYDRLNQSCPSSIRECIIVCLEHLSNVILNDVRHPRGGTQINRTPDQKRVGVSNTIKGYVSRLRNGTLNSWKNIMGPHFR